MPVEFSEYHRGHSLIVFRQVIDAEFFVCISIHKADECILNHSKMLISVGCLTNAYQNNNTIILRRKSGKIDHDLFVITITSASKVITLVNNTSTVMAEIIEEHHIASSRNLSAAVKKMFRHVSLCRSRTCSITPPGSSGLFRSFIFPMII